MGQSLTWLQYALLSAINEAAWWDAQRFSDGTVARYATRCSDAEWRLFTRCRARTEHMLACVEVA